MKYFLGGRLEKSKVFFFFFNEIGNNSGRAFFMGVEAQRSREPSPEDPGTHAERR